MTIRCAINGFGRIGRTMLRRMLTDGGVEPVAVNSDRGTPESIAHLFRYDTVFGRWPGAVEIDGTSMVVDGHPIELISNRDPAALPWHDLGIDVVAEATGRFTAHDDAAAHLRAGARKVLITAPASGADATLVVGVNDHLYDPDAHSIVSGASCTTNCLAPVAAVLHERFGILGGLVTTVHAYTRDQSLVDGTHEDPRRARAAAQNMVPTKTGAAKAIGLVLPDLAGRLVGIAIRVPVCDVSLLDLSVVLERTTGVEEINDAFRLAALTRPAGRIIGVCDEPLVSSDFRGDDRSCVIDAASTRGGPGNQFKVLAWYDNEWGYASRMVDLVRLIGAPLPAGARGRPATL
ncbi:MAG TPA: type I glyceraldehyde-3-phosphate dehydrogenase [Actinomycetota bacterium]